MGMNFTAKREVNEQRVRMKDMMFSHSGDIDYLKRQIDKKKRGKIKIR